MTFTVGLNVTAVLVFHHLADLLKKICAFRIIFVNFHNSQEMTKQNMSDPQENKLPP